MTGDGGTAFYEGPAYHLDNARRGSKGWRTEKEFDMQAWKHAALNAPLRPHVRQTAHAMADSYFGSRGVSKVDRTTVAKHIGVNRPATITDHWEGLRRAGLMVSVRRFNSSSIHLLTMPTGQRSANPLDADVLDLTEHLGWNDWNPQNEAPF